MRTIIYSRVSTDAQERDGTSLDSQETSCADFAASHGWHVVQCVRDAASGFTLERDGIERVRGMVRRGEVEVVLAHAVDRLSRNQNQIGVLFDEASGAGVRLEFVTERFEDTAIGRFILAARAFVAEVEREKISERTTRGKTERALSGRIPQATGKGIYGYIYDEASGTRRLHPNQAPIVGRVFEEFCDGQGVSRIARILNDEHVPTLSGGTWHPLTVRRILMNETYTGRTVYRRTRVQFSRHPSTGKRLRKVVTRDESEWVEVPDASPRIISPELFVRAQAILESPDRRQRGHATAAYRLRGRLRCMACGTPMTGQALGRGRWRYYRCRGSYTKALGGTCNERYVPRDLLERTVFEELVAVMTDRERLREEVERAIGPTEQQVPKRAIKRELARVGEQQKRLMRLFVSGELPEEFLQAEAARLRAERQRLEHELNRGVPGTWHSASAGDIRAALPVIVEQVASWARNAKAEDIEVLLRALDVRVRANRERAVIEASVPLLGSLQNQNLVTTERTSASRRARSRFRSRGGGRPGSKGSSSPARHRPKGR